MIVAESSDAENVLTAATTVANAGTGGTTSGAIPAVAYAPSGRASDPITGIADRIISRSTLLSERFFLNNE